MSRRRSASPAASPETARAKRAKTWMDLDADASPGGGEEDNELRALEEDEAEAGADFIDDSAPTPISTPPHHYEPSPSPVPADFGITDRKIAEGKHPIRQDSKYEKEVKLSLSDEEDLDIKDGLQLIDAEQEAKFLFPDWAKKEANRTPLFLYKRWLKDLSLEEMKQELKLILQYLGIGAAPVYNLADLVFHMNKLFPNDLQIRAAEIDAIADNLSARVAILIHSMLKLQKPLEEEVRAQKALSFIHYMKQARCAFLQAQLVQDVNYSAIYALSPSYNEGTDYNNLSDFQKALRFVVQKFFEASYRHDGKVLYEPDVAENGEFRHYWKRFHLPLYQVVHDLSTAPGDENQGWLVLTKNAKLVNDVATYFENSGSRNEMFPLLVRDRLWWRFQNVLFNSKECKIVNFKEIKEDIAAVQCFDTLFPNIPDPVLVAPFFRYGVDPRSLVRSSPEWKLLQKTSELDWFDCFEKMCPAWFKFLRYQFVEMPALGQKVEDYHYFDSEILLRFFCAFFGRNFLPLRANDNFQRVLTVIGAGGTGKSSLSALLERIIGVEDIGVLSNAMEKRFGLVSIMGKHLWVINEMRTGLALDLTDWLSLTGGDTIMMRIKFLNPRNWKNMAQGFMIGNEWPANYGEKLGSIQRRLLLFNFYRLIEQQDKDTALTDRLLEEAPLIFIFCCIAYRSMIEFMESKSMAGEISNFWHYSMDNNLKALEKNSNPVVEFLESSYVHVHSKEKTCDKKRCQIPLEMFKEALQQFITLHGKRWSYDDKMVESELKRINATITAPIRTTYRSVQMTGAVIKGVSLTQLWHSRKKSDSEMDMKNEAGAEDQVVLEAKSFAEPPLPPYLKPGWQPARFTDDTTTYEEQQIKLFESFNDFLDDIKSKLPQAPPEQWQRYAEKNIAMDMASELFDRIRNKKLIHLTVAFQALAVVYKSLIWQRYQLDGKQRKEMLPVFRKNLKKFREWKEVMNELERQHSPLP